MRMTRDGGRLVVVGQYTDAGEATFSPHADLNRKHLDVRGVWGFDYSHLHRGGDPGPQRGAVRGSTQPLLDLSSGD
jgi:L-iditol 2-dehydrogenase